MHCFRILYSKHQPSGFQMKTYTHSQKLAIIIIKLILEWWWKLYFTSLKAILSFQYNILKWKFKEKTMSKLNFLWGDCHLNMIKYLWTIKFHTVYFILFHLQVKLKPQKGGSVTTSLLPSIPEGFPGCCSQYKQKPASTMGSTTEI